jgi:heterodisulfide reductase subunit C2
MSQETITPDHSLLDQIEAAGPFQTGACFQCRKCTNGCPVTFAMDLYPDEVIRMVILGQRKTVLGCRTIWVCAACETCTTRCPNEVKIAEIMDCLKEMAIQADVTAPQSQILKLHQTFLNNIKTWGRVYETALLPAYLLKSGELKQKWHTGTYRQDIKLGLQMLAKGRFPLLPKTIKGKKEVREILAKPNPDKPKPKTFNYHESSKVRKHEKQIK